MPEVIWIFGPNGVGKTENAQSLNSGVEHFTLDKYILELVKNEDPKVIEQLKLDPENPFLRERFITYFSNNTKQGEALLYNDCIKKINNKESFSFENNFLPHRSHEILNKAIGNDFKLSIIGLIETDIDFIKARVNTRTQLTGQYVNPEEIKRRFDGGLKDINQLLDKENSLFPFKENIAEVMLFTCPTMDRKMNLVIQISENRLIKIDSKEVQNFKGILPNLKQWMDSRKKEK